MAALKKAFPESQCADCRQSSRRPIRRLGTIEKRIIGKGSASGLGLQPQVVTKQALPMRPRHRGSRRQPNVGRRSYSGTRPVPRICPADQQNVSRDID